MVLGNIKLKKNGKREDREFGVIKHELNQLTTSLKSLAHN